MIEHGPRAKKLLQAIDKTINATLEHKTGHTKNEYNNSLNNLDKTPESEKNTCETNLCAKNSLYEETYNLNIAEKKITNNVNDNINNDDQCPNNIDNEINCNNDSIIKQGMKDIFDTYVNSTLLQKMDNLDKQISTKRINLRSIKCNEYIKEILESYIVDKRIDLKEYIEVKLNDVNIERINLRKDVTDLKKQLEILTCKLNTKKEKIAEIMNVVNKNI